VPDSTEQTKDHPESALLAFPAHRNAAHDEISVKSGASGNAIVAFVLGLCGALPLTIIFGIRALMQIGDSPQKGKALAISGLCQSVLWLVVLILRFAS
jgi:Domain of unknown function (DUF4190)